MKRTSSLPLAWTEFKTARWGFTWKFRWIVALILCAAMPFLGTGCANPNGTQALLSLGNAALAYASGNYPAVASNALSAAAFGLRTLQGTPNAADTAAVTAAVTTTAQTLSRASLPAGATVTSKTPSTIAALVAAGTTPDQANELAAEVLDAAAQAKSAPGVRGSIGIVGRAP